MKTLSEGELFMFSYYNGQSSQIFRKCFSTHNSFVCYVDEDLCQFIIPPGLSQIVKKTLIKMGYQERSFFVPYSTINQDYWPEGLRHLLELVKIKKV